MNLQNRWSSGRRWLYALLVVVAMAVSIGGIQAASTIVDEAAISPQLACVSPCSDPGGGG